MVRGADFTGVPTRCRRTQIFKLTSTSDDGLCVIEYDVAEPGQVDRSTPDAMKLAAHIVLNICVQSQDRGGVATGLGSSLLRFV